MSRKRNLGQVQAPPLIVYLDLDKTIIHKSKSTPYLPRPHLVEFLNTLHDHDFSIRLYSNNCDRNTYEYLQNYLATNDCKVTLTFPTYEQFRESGETSLKTWRQKNPELGILRMFENDLLDKDLSEYLLDPEQLSRAILIDDDLSYWLRNFGRFIPALKYADSFEGKSDDDAPFPPPYIQDDWENGLMGRILAALLQIHSLGEIPSHVHEERKDVLAFALAFAVARDEEDKARPDHLFAPLGRVDLTQFDKFVIQALSSSDDGNCHAKADRVWFSTKVAFPGVSKEAIIETVGSKPSAIPVSKNPFAPVIWDKGSCTIC